MRCLSQFLLYTIHLCSFNAIRVISRWKIFVSIFGQKGNGLLVAVRGKQKQVDHLRNEVEELKHQLDAERAKNDALKAKITAYQKNDLSAVKKVEARYEEQLRILNE